MVASMVEDIVVEIAVVAKEAVTGSGGGGGRGSGGLLTTWRFFIRATENQLKVTTSR